MFYCITNLNTKSSRYQTNAIYLAHLKMTMWQNVVHTIHKYVLKYKDKRMKFVKETNIRY